MLVGTYGCFLERFVSFCHLYTLDREFVFIGACFRVLKFKFNSIIISLVSEVEFRDLRITCNSGEHIFFSFLFPFLRFFKIYLSERVRVREIMEGEAEGESRLPAEQEPHVELDPRTPGS